MDLYQSMSVKYSKFTRLETMNPEREALDFDELNLTIAAST